MASPFAKATLAPPAPTGVDTDKGALIADVQNGVPEIVDFSGNTHGLETMLLALSAQTALTNVTTAQNLLSKALNAFALNKVGRSLRISGVGIFTTSNSGTMTIAIVLGGVTLCTITSGTATATITNGQFTFEFWLTVVSTGATGTLESHGELGVQLSSTLSTAVPFVADQNAAVSSAVSLTSALTLLITAACSASFSSVQLRQLFIEVIN